MSARGDLAASLRAGLLVLVISSCAVARDGEPEREYAFVHKETTGITSWIRLPGASRPAGRAEGLPEVAIVFSKESDRDAVEALRYLHYRVLLPNGDGGGIVLVGVLDPRVRQSLTGPGRAASEPYQEFRLSRWYLRAPFPRWIGDDPLAGGETPRVQQDVRLGPEDFESRVGGDLSRFVRSR